MPTQHGLSAKHLQLIKEILMPFADSITHVSLFGSRATGTFRNNSDIDLVICGTLTEKETDRLWTLFAESSLPWSVDVKAYNLITYDPLKRHIDSVACILFTKEELQPAAS